jgi:HPt (histidine-containing phosphotransfer) domain-containing protein
LTPTEAGEIVVRVDPEIAEMVPRVLTNRGRDVDTLRQALAAGDHEAVRKTGHALKGVGGGYGFPMISEMGERIEQGTLDGQMEAVGRAVDELADFLARVRVELG